MRWLDPLINMFHLPSGCLPLPAPLSLLSKWKTCFRFKVYTTTEMRCTDKMIKNVPPPSGWMSASDAGCPWSADDLSVEPQILLRLIQLKSSFNVNVLCHINCCLPADLQMNSEHNSGNSGNPIRFILKFYTNFQTRQKSYIISVTADKSCDCHPVKTKQPVYLKKKKKDKKVNLSCHDAKVKLNVSETWTAFK